MQASGLMGDDNETAETPQIIEIQLKDLGATVDLEASKESPPKVSTSDAGDDDDDDLLGDRSDQCLLGGAVKTHGAGARACSHSDILAKLKALDAAAHAAEAESARHRSLSMDASAVDPSRNRSLSMDASSPLLPLPPPPPVLALPPPGPGPPLPLPRLPSSSTSSSGSTGSRGKRPRKKRGNSVGDFPFVPSPSSTQSSPTPPLPPPPIFASPSRVRFTDSLPNGSLVKGRRLSRHDSVFEADPALEQAACDNIANDRLEGRLVDEGTQERVGLIGGGDRLRGGASDALRARDIEQGGGERYKAFSDESRNLSSLVRTSKDVTEENQGKDNSVRSLLHKPRSYQDHLCFTDPSSNVCLDTVSKEELLLLWKTSELDLHKKLDEALKEKGRLEKKLALLQHQSPV